MSLNGLIGLASCLTAAVRELRVGSNSIHPSPCQREVPLEFIKLTRDRSNKGKDKMVLMK